MKRMVFNRVLALVVLVTFLFNDICFGLATQPGSTQHGTRDEMYALGQKLFGAKIGPGSIDFDSYDKSKGFVGQELLERSDGQPYISAANNYKTRFVPANYDQPPKGWENNPILQETSLIRALEAFRDTQAFIPSEKLEIREGWFPIEKDKGELPIAQIVPVSDGRYVLVVHTTFVRMWNHIRENDVWFEADLAPGNRRIVSVAWGLFYRLAKHEMAELSTRDIAFKNLGHIIYNLDTVQPDEGLANEIGGNYALFNDAIWMWFLGSYVFGDTTRYNNQTFLERTTWFFEGKAAQRLKLHLEFPNLLKDADKRMTATAFAFAINYNFFNRPGIESPDKWLSSDAYYVPEYHDNEIAWRAKNAISATGQSGSEEPKSVRPARIQIDHTKKEILITLIGGRSDGVYAVANLATNRAVIYASKGGPNLHTSDPRWAEAAGLVKEAVARVLRVLKEKRAVHEAAAEADAEVRKIKPGSESKGPLSDDEIMAILTTPEEDEDISQEPPVAGVERTKAKLTDLADHAVVNAVIGSMIEYAKSEDGLMDGDRGIYYDQDKRVFWLGSKFGRNRNFADLFDKLVSVHIRRNNIADSNEARLEVAGNLVKRAGLQDDIKVDSSYVKRLRSQLALQVEHFGVESGQAYVMRAYKVQPYAPVVIKHVQIERRLHHEMIKQLFGEAEGSFSSYRTWRRGIIRYMQVYKDISLKFGGVEIELPTKPMTYAEFVQWAHEKAEKLSPVSGLIKMSPEEVNANLKNIVPGSKSRPASEPPTAAGPGRYSKQGKPAPITLESPVRSLKFTNHANIVNALIRANILRVGDLVTQTREDLVALDGIKGPSADDIERTLAANGFKLRNLAEETVMASSPVRILGFTKAPRTTNALERAGVETVGDLVQLTRQKLTSFKGIDTVIANDIEEALARHGLGLKNIRLRDLNMAIGTYAANIGIHEGPGSETLNAAEAENIYKAINILKENRIEIFVPQDLRLTEAMSRAIKDLGKRDGSTPVVCRRYANVANLAKMLEVPTDAKRIIITEFRDRYEQTDMMNLVNRNPELVRPIRFLNIATPLNYAKMDDTDKTIYQAKIISIAILARLFEKGNTPIVEALLRTMMKGTLGTDDKDMDAFLDVLGNPDDGAGLSREALVQRILFLLGKTVRIVEKIGEEIRLMKNFWIAA